MKILMFVKYPPIQGGVSTDAYWTAQLLSEMGHDIHIVTNATEVEDEYRVQMGADDETRLVNKSVTLYRTYVDPKHVFIPQTNPSVSKLTGVGLRVARELKPDLIWAYYIEPYGVAAMLVSKLTGIPYTIRHAGSDLGRLMLTEQLEPLYREVFKNSLLVLTREQHFDRFKKIGVRDDQLIEAVGRRIPSDLFYPTNPEPIKDVFRLGIYGKAGPAKGSLELIEAISMLKSENFPCTLKAYWGGRHIGSVQKAIEVNNVGDRISVEKYKPHWEIPDFIRSRDAILFLENKFSISFHGPGIPLESLCCARPVLTTEEIERKQPLLLKKNRNCIVIPSSPLTPAGIAEGLREMYGRVQSGSFLDTEWPDSSCIEQRVRDAMSNLIQTIQHKLT